VSESHGSQAAHCGWSRELTKDKKGEMEMMRKREWIRKAMLIGCAAIFFTGAGKLLIQAANAHAQPVEVKIDNFTFAPPTLTVAAGTTVKWVNRDDIPHTVVSEDKSTFKSKAMDTDDSFSYTFTKPGTYNYFCSIHPKMVAKVVVQ
jgi:plastocyanin